MTTTAAGTVTYALDPAHSRAHFSVRHLMIATVRGEFTALTGTLTLDPADPSTAHVEASIDVNSVHTGQADRDTHLKSPDFFDAAQYPAITFSSSGVSKTSDDESEVSGNLTLHGVTKEVILKTEGNLQEVKDPYGSFRLAFTATGKIKRSDYGLVFNVPLETGGIAIGDDVNITLDVQFIKSA